MIYRQLAAYDLPVNKFAIAFDSALQVAGRCESQAHTGGKLNSVGLRDQRAPAARLRRPEASEARSRRPRLLYVSDLKELDSSCAAPISETIVQGQAAACRAAALS